MPNFYFPPPSYPQYSLHTEDIPPKELSHDVPGRGGKRAEAPFAAPAPFDPQRAAERQRRVLFGTLSPIDFARKRIEGGPGEPADPHTFFNSTLQAYPFSDDEKLNIAKTWRTLATQYSDRFVFHNPDKKLDFVGTLIGEYPSHASHLCEYFGVTKQEDLARVGNHLIEDRPDCFPEFLEQIHVEDEDQRFEWACKLAQTEPSTLIHEMDKFCLSNSRQRDAMFVAANNVSSTTGTMFTDQDFLTRDEKLNLLLTLAERSPRSCIYSVPRFPTLDEADRVKVAAKLSEKIGWGLLFDIEKFALGSEQALRFYIAHFRQYVEDRTKDNDRCLIPDFGPYRLTERVFRNAPSMPVFRQHAGELGIKLPCIAEFMDISRTESDPDLREVLGVWAHSAHLRFSGDIPESAKDDLSSTLQGIFQYRHPDTRYPLTNLLSQVINPEPEDQFFAQRFSAASAALKKPHTRVFRPLLTALTPGADAPSVREMVAKYGALLSKDGFKDTSRQRNVVNGFLALIQADHIANPEKLRLLKALTPAAHGKSDIKEFCQAMQNLADFIPLTALEDHKDKAVAELGRIRQSGDLDEALHRMFMGIMGRNKGGSVSDAQVKEFMQKIKQATDGFRRPNAFLNYATKLYTELQQGEEKDEIFKVLNRCLDAALLAPPAQSRKVLNSRGDVVSTMPGNPSQAFLDEKNDISKSRHLQKTYEMNPTVTRNFLTREIEIQNVFEKYGQSRHETNVTEYLRQRIVRDRHVSEGTFPVIERMLEHPGLSLEEARRGVPGVRPSPNEELLLKVLDDKEQANDKITAINELLPTLAIANEHEKEEFARNLRDLKLLLQQQNAPNQNVSGWSLKFAQNFEDYLLGGTEVIGSCQNIEGSARLNKALMGYVMQGKNRTITLNSPDGKIQARCIIRLGIDETSNRLVLHMEGSYKNPGVPGNCDEIFGKFARDLSRQLGGIPVVTHAPDYGETRPYPHSVSFLPDAAYCEYVDSQKLGVVNSRVGYSLTDAAILV